MRQLSKPKRGHRTIAELSGLELTLLFQWQAVVRFLVLLLLMTSARLASAVEPVTSASFQVGDGARPVAGQWQDLTLPLAPRGDKDLALNRTLWIQLRLPAPLPPEAALYLPRLNVAAQVYAGGTWLGGVREEAQARPLGWNTPLLIPLPATLTADDPIVIRLESGPFGAMLGAPLLGTLDELTPLYERRYFWQVTTAEWAFLLCVTLGLFTSLLWWRRRQDRLYLYFTGAAWCWAVLTLYMFMSFLPLPLRPWLALVHTAATWCGYLLVRFSLESLDRRISWLERGLLLVAVVATILHFVVPDKVFFVITYLLHLPNLLAVLLIGLMAMVDALYRKGPAAKWHAVGYAGVGLLVARDMYIFMASPDEVFVDASSSMHLAIPILLVMLFVHLVERFLQALDEAETLNRELESRVEANRAALVRSFETQRELEVEKGAAIEREKIYRDLHDEVGTRLVNIIHSEASAETRSLARSALESLRGAIYQARFPDLSVRRLVEELEEEFGLRLGHASIKVEFCADIVDPDRQLSSEQGYHLTRICRELISNILQHAFAAEVSIKVTDVDHALTVVVRDDGVGGVGMGGPGGGLQNARARVGDLGGEIAWQSGAGGGTTVDLRIPLT